MRRSPVFLLFLSMVLISPFVLTDVFADTINWTGNGDGTSFNDPTNWDLDRVPISTDEILINPGNTNCGETFTILFEGDFIIDNSLITGCDHGFFANYNSVLTVNGLFVGKMEISRAHIINNGEIVIIGFMTNDDDGILDNYNNFTINGPLVNYGEINNHGILTNNNTVYYADTTASEIVNFSTGTINNNSVATIIVENQCSDCGPASLQNDGAINNDGDIILECGSTLSNSGTFSGFVPTDMCNDADSDSILDDIDTDLGVFSDGISDILNSGSTTATILNRGAEHTIIVADQPNPDGVRISVIPLITFPLAGFDSPLTLSQCGNTEVTLNTPDKAIISCGSSIIEAQLGQIEITLTGTDGSIFTTTLNPPNRITFEPDTLTFIADNSNTSTITINGDSDTILLEPGQTVSLGSFCGKPQSDYNIITGTESDDVLIGTNADDLIFGLGGNDKIKGKKGNDCIFGGNEDDKIWGGKGNDTIDAGDGNDTVYSNQDNDSILGGNGNDKIHGGQGDDSIDGGEDTDKCHGGKGTNSFVNCEDTKPKMSDSEDE